MKNATRVKVSTLTSDRRGLVEYDYEQTGIGQMFTDKGVTPIGYYSVDGVCSNEHHRGINIVRMSDDTIRKIISKF